MKYWRLIMAGLAFILALTVFIWGKLNPYYSFPPEGTVQQRPRPIIATSFYPVTYLVQQIAGDGYDVRQVTPGGVEPHDFEPSPQDIVQLQKASMLVAVGLGLEPWVERLQPTLTESGVTVVTVAGGVEKKGVALLAGDEHGHANPHLWLDPTAMQAMAGVVGEALTQQFPQDKTIFLANTQRFLLALVAVDESYKTGLASCRVRDVIVSHDAFAYLARQYDINIIPIAGFSPQEQPSAKRVTELVMLAKQKGIKTIFFETLVSPKLSMTLAQEVGATTDVLDPIEGFSETDLAAGKTYITAMNANLSSLRKAMDCE